MDNYIITCGQLKPSITLIPKHSQRQLQENICKQCQPQWLNQWSSEKNHIFLGLGYIFYIIVVYRGSRTASFPLWYISLHTHGSATITPSKSVTCSLIIRYLCSNLQHFWNMAMSVANQSYRDITARRKGCHLHCWHRHGQNTNLLDAPFIPIKWHLDCCDSFESALQAECSIPGQSRDSSHCY